MHRCLDLARRGMAGVAPNPMVGAVLVHQGRVIGEGFHQRFGEAHAEVHCISSVAEADRPLIPESTLYVSLEPCSHFGKTPPCTDLIIKNRIPQVVIGCTDSFSLVNGQGIKSLEAAGIDVVAGVLEHEARKLNERFFTFHEKKRPFVILKWAQSANGCIANADLSRVRITQPATNTLVHRWRTEEQAIMVGTRTALLDDPMLTSRLWDGPDPVRVFIDLSLQVPSTHHLLDGTIKTIVFNSIRQDTAGLTRYEQIDPSGDLLSQVLERLYAQQILSILVEGGARLLQSFLEKGCWDEARVITGTAVEIPGGYKAPNLPEAFLSETHLFPGDIIRIYHPKH